jgi:hypothetical protein
MKKNLLIISSLFIGLMQLAGQTSMQLSNNSAGGIISNNDIITEDVLANGQSHVYIAPKNISSTAKTYALKRTDVTLNPGAEAYFCFGGQCFPSTTTITPVAYYTTLTSNQLDSPQSLYYDETTVEGYSEIKYELFDVNNTSDLLTFTFKFNPLLASVKNNHALFSSVSEIYPNPNSGNARFVIHSIIENKSSVLNITNVLGTIVSSKNIELSVGKNSIEINSDELNSGIYFATIIVAESKITKRFTITK